MSKFNSITIDCNSNGTLYGNQFTFNQALDAYRQTTIKLKSATVPFSFYNISQNLGRTMTLLFSGIPYTITLAVGQYTLNTLVTAVVDAFTLLGRTMTLALLGLSQKVFMTSTEPIIIPNAVGSIYVDHVTDMLGFDVHSVASTSFVADFLPDMVPIKNIMVRTNVVEVNGLNSQRQGILGNVPVQGSFGALIVFNDVEAQWFNCTDKALSSLTVEFIDQEGNFIDFNGRYPVLTFILEDSSQ